MKLIHDSERIANSRVAHINNLKLDGYTPTFDKEDTKRIMKVHFDLLQNYISQFGLYLWVYWSLAGPINRWRILRVMRLERLKHIVTSYTKKIEKDYITINEVFLLCEKLKIKNDFLHYVASKTNLSYTIFKSYEPNPVAVTKHLKEDDMYAKFSQFIFSILAEYTILHNLMFASEMKLKEITSIDRWMVDLD